MIFFPQIDHYRFYDPLLQYFPGESKDQSGWVSIILFLIYILLPKSFVFIVHVFAFVVYCSSILLQGI